MPAGSAVPAATLPKPDGAVLGRSHSGTDTYTDIPNPATDTHAHTRTHARSVTDADTDTLIGRRRDIRADVQHARADRSPLEQSGMNIEITDVGLMRVRCGFAEAMLGSPAPNGENPNQ